jgi:hypothetical protein
MFEGMEDGNLSAPPFNPGLGGQRQPTRLGTP